MATSLPGLVRPGALQAWTKELVTEFQPRRLLPTLTAGVVIGVITIVLQLSYAVLIFSGPLEPYVGNGIGLALFGAVIFSAFIALTSSFRDAIATPQDTPAAILALIAAVIVKSMPSSASGGAIYVTVVAAIAVTSLLTGAFFLALGVLNLGSLVRFVPYPVIGGFLAGIGWLLARGAVGVMADVPLEPSQLVRLVQFDQVMRWLPGLVFAAALLVLQRRYKHFLILPAVLLGGLILFYAGLAVTHTSVAEASAGGWLLGPLPQGALWQPLTPAALGQVDWPVIAGQLDRVGTILLLSMIGLLLNASGLELAVRQDLDLNRELKSAGIANLIAGLGGSPVGFQTLSFSALANRMGANSRLVGIAAAAVCGLTLLFGVSLLSLFPKVILGGLLLFLGLSFLVEWVYDSWFKLPRADYALILLIMVIIGAVGLLEGIATGVAIAVVLFVVNYSRINLVKHMLTGASFRSTVDRPAAQRQLLRARGEQLDILQLEGFIFFGTAQNLLNQIRRRVDDPNLKPLRFLVLDFMRVSGLDSSAASSFLRLEQLAEAKNFQLVLSQVSGQMQQQLRKDGLSEEQMPRVHFFPTLDQGVEWCEEQVLSGEPRPPGVAEDMLETHLAEMFPEANDRARFMNYLERQDVAADQRLVRQGDPADSLYFLCSGAGIVQFELPDGRKVRLREMRPGTVIGEVGLYLAGPRTASVWTTRASTVYRLPEEAIRRMESEDPDLAAALHRWLGRLMAERLAENNNLLAAMLD